MDDEASVVRAGKNFEQLAEGRRTEYLRQEGFARDLEKQGNLCVHSPVADDGGREGGSGGAALHERTVANALLPRGDTALPDEILQSTQELCGLSIEQLSSTFIGSANGQSLQYLISTFEEVLNIGIGFKMQRQVKLAKTSTPETKSFDDIPETGINLEQLYRNFEGIALESSNWASPNFMGFPDSGNAVPALAASILIPFLNQNMANQEICAPTATFIEMEVVHWLRQQLGYEVPGSYGTVREIGGVLTLGGCLSNTIALMAARESLFPGSSSKGLPFAACNIRVLVPEVIEHYSVRSAMSWLSMGEENITRVPVDDEFRMKLDMLEQCIEDERAKGRFILACVAYAGDSRSMRVDNLKAIGELLQKKKVWFHVDACHGSQLAFSQKHRHTIDGIQLADSVTIDPHKVLWIPNTCSFVLFKDPRRLASISTNSDLILKTQWSLGQITPCIGSKAFDALKLWSIIKFYGRSGIERLVDERLALTKSFQAMISSRGDLLLLNKTDINSCMFIFLPPKCQTHRLSAADQEKINECNQYIKTKITQDGFAYIHGFMLKRCPHPLIPEGKAVYALRTMNGNPLTKEENFENILNSVSTLGRQFLNEKQYRLHAGLWEVSTSSVFAKLDRQISMFMGDTEHAAVIYGSRTSAGNHIESDVDIMIFAEDEFCTNQTIHSLKNLVLRIFDEEKIARDAEVPYDRKLLVPISFAADVPQTIKELFHNEIPSIVKSTEYLNSDEMLSRLILNVLTVPHIYVCGSPEFIGPVRESCEQALIEVISKQDANKVPQLDPKTFVTAAMGDGTRFGEAYLGYKDRPEVVSRLHEIFYKYRDNMSHRNNIVASALPQPQVDVSCTLTQSISHESDDSGGALLKDLSIYTEKKPPPRSCVILINGFPGVGKFTIAKELQNSLPQNSSILIDNHQLIDPVIEKHPQRDAAHYEARKALRRKVFGDLSRTKGENEVAIMTGCWAKHKYDEPQPFNDVEAFEDHAGVARARRVPLVTVSMTCDAEENLERVDSEERKGGEKTKLVDRNILSNIRRDFELLNMTSVLIQGVSRWHLELDVTDLSPKEAAEEILKVLQSLE